MLSAALPYEPGLNMKHLAWIGNLQQSVAILGNFGLIGMQLPEKYKENFDISSEEVSY